jgi:cytochrome c556
VDNSTYAEDLARLQKQEHAANEEAKRLGLEFSQDTEALLRQAALDASRNRVSADGSPVAADANSPYGISAVVPVSTATSTSLDEPFTRFPSPSDLGNRRPSARIFQSASYDDDFAPTLTNLETSVDVNPNPTKRINIIHPLTNVLGDPSAMVQTRSTVKNT